jgi:hypothetical protein
MGQPNLPYAAHDWAITGIAPDFRLLDVWPLPMRGTADDFDAALALITDFDPADADSTVTRFLFWFRYRLGALFGWDDASGQRPIPGRRETSLSARLPEHLRGSVERRPHGSRLGPETAAFQPLYRTDEDWAAELSNGTVHGVLHLAWVEEDDNRYRAHLGVYVKPRGRLGSAYLLLIAPFRHLIVYPALMRQLGRAWRSRESRVDQSVH